MGFLNFQIAALFYVLLLSIVYFTKERINNLDNKIFSMLIIVNFIGVILDISSTYMAFYDFNNIALNFISKLYLLYMTTWLLLFTIYIISISKKTLKLDLNQKWFVLTMIFYVIFSVLVLEFPLYNFCQNNEIYTYGPSVTVTYTFSGICSLIWIICLITNRKDLKNKKYIPLLAFAIAGLTAGIIQFMLPEVLIITFVLVFINFLMYFTIENPDLRVIEKLKMANEMAEKANKAKSDFLSSMSHEIRTPLNAIVGFSECIKTEKTLEEAKDDADDVIKASDSLLEIVNGILDVSKIEANKMEIVNTDYELLPELEYLSKLVISRIGEKPIELETSFAPDIPAVMHGDVGKIKQIIMNLLTNAAKYTEQGKIKFAVKCINENDNCSLTITVTDTGRGIKTEKLDKLFTKFNRLEEDRNTTLEGTGLGLAITKSFTEMMGGKVVVQSIYGEGSTFTVFLKQQIVQLHGGLEKINRTEIEEELDFSNFKVLVVDDNKLNLRVADKLLKKHNINTVLVDSGLECISLVKSGETYDLILMDDMMPKMRGSEVLKELKQLDNFNIPTVALTANALSGMREAYIRIGFNDYLAKPIEKNNLILILKKYLKSTIETKKLAKESNNINSIEQTSVEPKDHSNKRVLIVDDNKLNIKIATNFLKPYNFVVEEALSGFECLDKVKQNNYDLILMDDMMPEMSGVEALHKLKEDPNFETKVIALTANAVNGARESYLKEGFDEYISKPIKKDIFDKILNDLFGEIDKSLDNNEVSENIDVDSVNNKQEMIDESIQCLKDNDIDVDQGIKLSGNIEIYKEELKKFLFNINDKIEILKKYKEEKNLSEYETEMHLLGEKCKCLGMLQLVDYAFQHEYKAKKNDIDFINNNFYILINKIYDDIKIIDKYIK